MSPEGANLSGGGCGDADWPDLLTAFNGKSITYDAIGNPLSDGTWTYAWQHGRQLGAVNPLRYRGYVYDTETGLYYLNSRYYNPVWGRFVNADGYASTGQGFDGHNMFAYCGNEPVNRYDVGGMFWKEAIRGITHVGLLLRGG